MKANLDRQIQLAVRDVVIRLSRDEAPDAATLALALASGETVQSLTSQAQDKADRRNKPKEAPVQTITSPSEPAVNYAEPAPQPARSHNKK
jgi:hypothetical protein